MYQGYQMHNTVNYQSDFWNKLSVVIYIYGLNGKFIIYSFELGDSPSLRQRVAIIMARLTIQSVLQATCGGLWFFREY